MTASHSRAMLVEGSECSDVLSTFKHQIVGCSVYLYGDRDVSQRLYPR